MKNDVLAMMWKSAQACADRTAFVNDWRLSSGFGDDGDFVDCVEMAGTVWDVAHMSIRDIVKVSGLSQAAFAARIGAPTRTVEDWCRGVRTPPEYVRLLVALDLKLISR